MRPSDAFDSSASYCFGALASTHCRASARKAASCGVSSKFIGTILSLVVPANAGTHNHRGLRLCDDVAPRARPGRRSIWVPAFAGTTAEYVAGAEHHYTRPLVGILLNGTSLSTRI